MGFGSLAGDLLGETVVILLVGESVGVELPEGNVVVVGGTLPLGNAVLVGTGVAVGIELPLGSRVLVGNGETLGNEVLVGAGDPEGNDVLVGNGVLVGYKLLLGEKVGSFSVCRARDESSSQCVPWYVVPVQLQADRPPMVV